MSITIYNFKKWARMLTGRSILHVKQDVGKVYSENEVSGYYNDLTEKVTRDKNIKLIQLPLIEKEDGTNILFSIAIFQFGLGSYDMFLLTKKDVYLEKFKICVDWAIDNQKSNGSWETFLYEHKEAPYSSMAQGEGASLLVRAYIKFKDKKYLKAAKKALEFMVLPVEEGGTAEYKDGGIYLKEFTNKPVVLNGWIFSIFGLYDYLLVENNHNLEYVYKNTLETLKRSIKVFDNGYWSKYDADKKITSPFYHKLHISQLKVLYELTNESIFKKYAIKWKEYEEKLINKNKAFLIKAYQKITE